MTDTTATFYDVISFDGRIFPFGECRRVVRGLAVAAGIGFGSMAAAGALVTAVAVTASWVIKTALATNPNTKAAHGSIAIALADHYPALAGAAEPADPPQVSAGSSDVATFESRWAGATAPETRSGGVPVMPQNPFRAAELTSTGVLPLAYLSTVTRPPKLAFETGGSVPLPRPHPAQQFAAVAPPSNAEPQQAHDKSMPLPDLDGRTAVYDIAAHTVYLPNGDRLEAHSGLGDKLDDPRYVSVKDRGPTPPNVYELTLREQLFHDVQAIRLNPVGDSSMFGRDGMLAHPYMLGANGQSNGCVSFKDYPAFLHAYLRGEVDRLVVVPHLGNMSWRTASVRRGAAPRYADNNP